MFKLPIRTAEPIRRIFREAFPAAGLVYFNPHSLRNTLVQLGETRCRTPEEFKAWSQNLGHEGVLTTFYSYGTVAGGRQGEILRALEQPGHTPRGGIEELLNALARKIRSTDRGQ
ncbi:MAG: integrase/recombinase XerD [Hyphomicrobiaceae bacterium]